jgi:hypothetical protein
MAVVAARLARKEGSEVDPKEREQVALVRRALREKRFSFNPHDAVEVDALIEEFSRYANALELSGPSREAS